MPRPLHAQPISGPVSDDSAPLNWADLDLVRAAVAEVAPSWSTELNCGSLDESTIVVLPPGANDLIGPAFVLHRTRGRVHLDQFRWDEYRKLGGFASVEAALNPLRARLATQTSLIAHGWDGGTC
jgi:hypothetical protein